MQICTILTLFLMVLQTFFLSKTTLPFVLFRACFGSSSQRQAVSFLSPKGGDSHLFACLIQSRNTGHWPSALRCFSQLRYCTTCSFKVGKTLIFVVVKISLTEPQAFSHHASGEKKVPEVLKSCDRAIFTNTNTKYLVFVPFSIHSILYSEITISSLLPG